MPLRSGSLGAIVLNFKSVTTRRINQIRQMAAAPVWQRNYYEHIIRDDGALQKNSGLYPDKFTIVAS